MHICGRLHTVYEELPQLHCDAFSFDACVPVAEIRPWLKGKAVMGNINTHALCDQSQQKIARLVEVAVAKGVDIVAPACGLAVTTPLANICAMVEAAREADDKGGADEL